MHLRYLRRAVAALTSALGIGLCGQVLALDYPVRPVHLVCAHVAGGAVDIFTRLLGQKLAEAWSQSIVIDNRPGAAGAVAAQMVVKAPADGYTLMVSTNAPITTNPYLYKSLGYQWSDFEPIALVAEGPVAVILNPSLLVRDIPGLIDYAKSHPGVLSTASAGSGSIGHFLVAELRREYGMILTHVPYKGGVQAAAAVASGEVQLGFIDPGASAPFIRDGRIKVLAITSQRRSSIIPDTPTLKELGIPGFEVATWIAVTGPKGIGKDIVNRINADVRTALQDAALRARLIPSGLEPFDGPSPSAVGEFIASEAPRGQQRVRDAGLTVE